MSYDRSPYSGEFHTLLRIKGGPPELLAGKIALFHAMIKKCDSDWPYIGRSMVRVCRRCLGVCWNSPRIGPEDFKAAARQVGGLKVKIRHFASLKNCRGGNVSFDYQNDILTIPIEEAHTLYGPGGVAAFREAHKIPSSTVRVSGVQVEGVTPTVTVPGIPEVPPIPEGDSSLIHRVLLGEGDTVPETPLTIRTLDRSRTCSAVQSYEGMSEADLAAWGGLVN